MDSSAFRSSVLFEVLSEVLSVPLCALVVALAAAPAAADHHEAEAAGAAAVEAMEAADVARAAAPAPAAPEPAAEAPTGSVSRASFTAAVVDREPVGEITSLTEETDEVLFFSELRGLEGRTVTHRWEFDGTVVAEVPFDVGGPRWRVHSSKRLLPEWTGEWSVTVVDESGVLLAPRSFTYAPAPQQAAQPPAAARTAQPPAAAQTAQPPAASLPAQQPAAMDPEPEAAESPEPTPLPASQAE